MIRIYMEVKDYNYANGQFKELAKYTKIYPLYEFFYYFERANYYFALNFPVKQFLALQKTLTFPNAPISESLSAYISLGKIYLYTKNEPQKAINLLKTAEKLITSNDLESLNIHIQLNEILSDAFTALHQPEFVAAAQHEVTILKSRRDKII